jgi:hypothetical protein
MSVTRTWVIAACGLALIAAAGVTSLLFARNGHSFDTDSSPFPVGQTFTSTEWEHVTERLERRGFNPATMGVVSGMRLQSPAKPLALVRATSSRGLCFIPVLGSRAGTATCSLSGHLEQPMLVYAATDHWSGKRATVIVGVARRSVVGVSMTDRRGFGSGAALIPSPGHLWSFAGGYGGSRVVVQARAASGRVVSHVQLP